MTVFKVSLLTFQTPIWIKQSTIKGSDAAATAATKFSRQESEKEDRKSSRAAADVTDNSEVFEVCILL